MSSSGGKQLQQQQQEQQRRQRQQHHSAAAAMTTRRPLRPPAVLVAAAALALVALVAFVAPTPALAAKNPNPYADKPYAGCDEGYCAPADPAAEAAFLTAAADGDTAAVKATLKNSPVKMGAAAADDKPAAAAARVNLTRNMVPDAAGFIRVVDVALWAASRAGHLEVVTAVLDHPGVRPLYDYEDGHILELAATEGHTALVEALLARKMPVSTTAMAHAAYFNRTDIMRLLLGRPTDLKAAMQAVARGGDAERARVLLEAMEKQPKEEERQGSYDWYADYVQQALNTGNVPVVRALLEHEGRTLHWQQAEAMVEAAVRNGSLELFTLLLAQPVFQEDPDELGEAIERSMKLGAELGARDIVAHLLKAYPDEAKGRCKAATYRATKFAREQIKEALIAGGCEVDKDTATGGPRMMEALFFGDVFAAARRGDAEALRELLLTDERRAGDRLKKLREVAVDPDTKQKGPTWPKPEHDPLVEAAKHGHGDAALVLAEFGFLNAARGAVEAAKGGHMAAARALLDGPARRALGVQFSMAPDAPLRAVAHAMEAGEWEFVAWVLNKSRTHETGPYLLTAIAQHGKLDDLHAMLRILEEQKIDKTEYFKAQVHSAMVTAALAGHYPLVAELQRHTEPLTPDEVEEGDEALEQRQEAFDDAYGDDDDADDGDDGKAQGGENGGGDAAAHDEL